MDTKSDISGMTHDLLDPIGFFQPMVPAAWTGTALLERFADLGSELTSFAANRLKEDVQAQHDFLHCVSLSDVQQVQAKFVQRALDQYHCEAAKLVKMAEKAATDLQGAQNTDA